MKSNSWMKNLPHYWCMHYSAYYKFWSICIESCVRNKKLLTKKTKNFFSPRKKPKQPTNSSQEPTRNNWRNAQSWPRLLAFEQLAVGGDLELESHLGVHDDLELADDRLQLRAHVPDLTAQSVVLVVELALPVVLLTAQHLQLAQQVGVLQQQQ